MFRKIAIIALFSFCSATVFAQQQVYNDYLSRGESLYGMQKYEEAEREFRLARRGADATVAERIDYLSAMCHAKRGDGIGALEAFLRDYPSGRYSNTARADLGAEYVESNEWAKALKAFAAVEPLKLTDTELDRYCFMRGYAAYKSGDNRQASEWLAKADKRSTYYSHSQYLSGLMDYAAGNTVSARKHFESAVGNADYAAIIPFYLLNMEYSRGEYQFAADNVDKVLQTITGDRYKESLRIGAESNFMLQRWSKAVDFIERIREFSGSLNRDENYIAGYSAYRAGDYSRAADYLRHACGPDDRLTQNASYHLADCYLHLNDRQNAMESFAMAYNGEGDSKICEDALYNYCKLQVEQGGSQFNREIQTLRQYLLRYPSSPHRAEIESYFISACYEAKDLKGAYDALSEFSSSSPAMRRAMQLVAYNCAADNFAAGRTAEAEEYCNVSLDFRDADSRTEAAALFLLGEIDYAEGNYQSAAATFREYIGLKPTSSPQYPLAHYNLGYARFNDSKMDAAHDSFVDFVELYGKGDSYRADAFNRLGDIEAASKAYARASEYYSRSADIKEADEHYYGAYNAALMEGLAGHSANRIKLLRGIIAEGGGDYLRRADYELGHTLLLAGNYKEAAKTLKSFVARYPSAPDYISALSDLGLAYRNLGNDEDALKSYKRVVEISRGSVASRNALGEIMNIYIDRNEVDKYFDYASSLGLKGDADAMQRDSMTFVAAQKIYISGDKQRAAAAFDQYLASNPSGAYSAAALYYCSDCYAVQGDNKSAVERLNRLTGLYYNNYTQRGYERLAEIETADKNFAAAAAAYRRLSSIAVTPRQRRQALEGYLKSVVGSGDNNAIIAAADEIASSKDATGDLVRAARFAKAKALMAQGKRNPAVAIFNDLSTDVSTPEGAESAYIIIETAYEYGSKDKAEEMIMDFSSKNTSQTYWLAKAFLRLGDIYSSRDDSFQARATYQSIVDGYSVKDDGIIEEARQRILKLK